MGSVLTSAREIRELTEIPTNIAALATLLIETQERQRLLRPLAEAESTFGVDAANRVLEEISVQRRADGWRQLGWKIGFTNRSIWKRYGVSSPIWAPMWTRTVEFASRNCCTVPLAAMVQPRIEPEIVFKLCRPLPKTDDPAEILHSVEWFAPGFEIVQCHFPDWKFSAADCIADFGLHGLLVIGSPVHVAGLSCTALASELSQFAVVLSCGSTIVDHGGGSLVLGSPLNALAHLNRALERSGHGPLAGGEVVTTGTLTDAWPVLAGETWSADYTTLGTQPLSIRFA